MNQTLAGGCQCGHVRYEARIESPGAYLCHCRMCQRATGGFAAAFVNLPRADVRWIGEPDWYASSPIAERAFCHKCGSPIGFRYPDSDKIDLTFGSFDDPSSFAPTSHFGAEAIHEAWLDTRDLPRQRCDEYERLVDRWDRSGAAMPE